jgi:hypothetical protein
VGGLAAGVLVSLAGGRLMGGSLDLLARSFEDSRLRLDALGRPFGEDGFGPLARLVSSGLEGLIFGCCVVGAIVWVQRGERPNLLPDTDLPPPAHAPSAAGGAPH